MFRRQFLQGMGVTTVGLFSSSEQEKRADERKRYEEDAIKAHDLLERLAQEAEPEALLKRPEILAAALSEHERQLGGFKFECRRYGDFLTVFVTRDGNPEVPEYVNVGPARYTSEIPERIFSTTLNIGRTTEIRLLAGNPADDGGKLGYGYQIKHGDGGGATVGGTGFGNYVPSSGRYEVMPRYPRIPYHRTIFYLDPPPQPHQSGMIFNDQSYEIKFKTEPYARVAIDDRIRFEGIGATLFIPATLGEKVQGLILNELSTHQ